MKNTLKVLAITVMASAAFFIGRLTQTDPVMGADPAPAVVPAVAAPESAVTPAPVATPAIAGGVSGHRGEPAQPAQAVVIGEPSPATTFGLPPEEELEEPGVPLPVLKALPAVIINGKQKLPSVTPVFPHQVDGKRAGAGVIDYDPNERAAVFEQVVRHNRVKGDILETRWQGAGRPRRGDKSFLFNTGRTFFGQADTNGHVEGSPTNGVSFNAPKRVLGGYGTFVTGYVLARREDGKKVRVALNIVYIMRQGGVVLRNPDVWNLREFFVAGNESFVAMSDKEIFENEATWAGSNNDRAYFALVAVPAGGIIDPVNDRQRLLKEKQFFSFSEGLPFELAIASSGSKKK